MHKRQRREFHYELLAIRQRHEHAASGSGARHARASWNWFGRHRWPCAPPDDELTATLAPSPSAKPRAKQPGVLIFGLQTSGSGPQASGLWAFLILLAQLVLQIRRDLLA